MTKKNHRMTVILDNDLHSLLSGISDLNSTTITDIVKTAIASHLEKNAELVKKAQLFISEKSKLKNNLVNS